MWRLRRETNKIKRPQIGYRNQNDSVFHQCCRKSMPLRFYTTCYKQCMKAASFLVRPSLSCALPPFERWQLKDQEDLNVILWLWTPHFSVQFIYYFLYDFHIPHFRFWLVQHSQNECALVNSSVRSGLTLLAHDGPVASFLWRGQFPLKEWFR